MAVAKPLSIVSARAESVLDLVPDIDRGVGPGGLKATRSRPRRPDLAKTAARRIAAAARREQLVLERERLWSELLDLDEWRRHLIARCRGTCRRHQDRLDALSAERGFVAPAAAAPTPRGVAEFE